MNGKHTKKPTSCDCPRSARRTRPRSAAVVVQRAPSEVKTGGVLRREQTVFQNLRPNLKAVAHWKRVGREKASRICREVTVQAWAKSLKSDGRRSTAGSGREQQFWSIYSRAFCIILLDTIPKVHNLMLNFPFGCF